jgi:hypothetical protein
MVVFAAFGPNDGLLLGFWRIWGWFPDSLSEEERRQRQKDSRQNGFERAQNRFVG